VLSEAQKQGLVAPNGVTDLPQVNPPASSGSTTSTTSVRPSSTGATGVRAQSSTGTAAARSGGR
jgi:hypothetical protein